MLKKKINKILVGTNNTKPGISGVYVDGAFKPSTITGTYAHHVDYFDGRVVFDTAIPTGSVVQAEFSYKWINVLFANNDNNYSNNPHMVNIDLTSVIGQHYKSLLTNYCLHQSQQQTLQ